MHWKHEIAMWSITFAVALIIGAWINDRRLLYWVPIVAAPGVLIAMDEIKKARREAAELRRSDELYAKRQEEKERHRRRKENSAASSKPRR